MMTFVLSGHHAVTRPNLMLSSRRNTCTGHCAITHRASQFCGREFIPQTSGTRTQPDAQPMFSTPRAMFSGGGGILGVGPSEVVVIIAVGWLVLGPEKLFSLAKDSGRLLGELRRSADEAKSTFNEAMELDLIAAEFEESKKAAQENGAPESDSEGKLSDESDEAPSTSDDDEAAQGAERPGDVEDIVADNVEPVVNSVFLEQLQRVADPNQTPPEQQLPDLDPFMEEEQEVLRLEKQYFEARTRLEKRKRQQTENKASESEPVVEER